MPSHGLRYRRCPACVEVQRSSAYRRATRAPMFGPSGQHRRQCPACGHVDLLAKFPIVERPEPGV